MERHERGCGLGLKEEGGRAKIKRVMMAIEKNGFF
jgi:hypothetical protein